MTKQRGKAFLKQAKPKQKKEQASKLHLLMFEIHH